MTKKTWVHTHLPRLQAHREGRGDDNVLSVKVPGEKITYLNRIVLRDAEFTVSKAGRKRCLETGVRNVHAWVVGEALEDFPIPGKRAKVKKAVYDPWKGDSFVDAITLQPVHRASMVWMSGKDVYYVD